jgi:hypothetical protein
MAEEILARWRDVERHLAALPKGSEEAADLQAEAAELRARLREITEDVSGHGSESPPDRH